MLTPATRRWTFVWTAAAAAAGLALGVLYPATAATDREGRNTAYLTVCGDPNNLPFSNDKMEGFENRVAQIIADALDRPLHYRWWPQSVGFVRNTLQTRLCDLIMGITSVNEMVQNSNPYYRSVYSLVQRADDTPRIDALSDPALKSLRIGVVAGTPPATLIARYGLMTQTRPYLRTVDTRHFTPATRAVEDVAAGEIDVAVIWGPIAGNAAAQQDPPLRVQPLPATVDGVTLAFNVSMGLRHRERRWKHELNNLIEQLGPQFQQVLLDYRVPLLDSKDQPILTALFDTEGYRIDQFRSPVPEQVPGAGTISTEELEQLLGMSDAHPVLVDVLPSPPKPEGLAETSLWLPPTRNNIPGSIWLPNVGYGRLSDALDSYFRVNLERSTNGDKTRPIIVYCLDDCWMSWNAARRAAEYGYSQVLWYPEGTDGWEFAEHDLEVATPAPME